jgi:drug/metabolite transporter (DMT)-like permease
VGLFVLVLLVVRRWTASATSYMFVLFPVVTMALGAWLADEPVTAQGLTGAGLVTLGVWFGALSPNARRLAAPLPAHAPPQVTKGS